MFSLNTHSYYTLLEGAISPERLTELAYKDGSEYVVLTDTNGMYGLVNLASSAEEKGIKAIFGVTIDEPGNKENKATFIAKNNEGYSKLCKIITARKLRDDFSLVELFKSNLSDLFIITSSLTLLESLKKYSLLKKDLFVELIASTEKNKQTRALFDFARANSLRYIASNPIWFENKDDYLFHKALVAIRKNSTLENIDQALLANKEYYFKGKKVFREQWRGLPEALDNVDYIAKNSNVNMKLGNYKFPVFPLPSGETSYSFLWKICFKGLEEKYHPITDKVIKRLQYELEVIDELGFCDYFLVVWDIVREATSRRMMTIGRGSAANSLVSFCLGFTQVDPLRHDLYFERFLNRGRTSPPDVDLDFSWRERDDIVKYVFEKYGYERVAMISTIITFRARSAFRETAKVFGIPEGEISKFSKFIPWTTAENLPRLAEKFPEAKELKFDEEPWSEIIRIASRLGGFPRHLSIHPGGIVIAPEAITNHVALEYAKNKGLGLIITQPDMYSIEKLGLIKIDLLSQRSLGVLRDTLDLVGIGDASKKRKNIPIFDIGKE